ncbi:MAG: PEP-CTERM sorting domain-containing protein [Myxococcota bacterium]
MTSRTLTGLCVMVAVHVLLLTPAVVRALPITVVLEGTLGIVSGTTGPLAIGPGSPVRVVYTFESSAPDENPDPALGKYQFGAPSNLVVTLDGTAFSTPVFQIAIKLPPFTTGSASHAVAGNGTLGGDFFSASAVTTGLPLSLVTSDALITDPAILNSSIFGTGFSFAASGPTFQFETHQGPLRVVPEPGSAALAGLGLGLLTLGMRCRSAGERRLDA